jgi:uncharacterized protein YndB with AHSA1/START domain
MASATETFTVERELTIAARPETVWKLLVDPAEQSSWWGTALDFDARPGGPFRVEVIPGHIANGEFVEVAEPSRLVYTWGWEGEGSVQPGASTIEIVLEQSGDGTKLTFVHSGLPSEEAAASHAQGWNNYLPRLALRGEGGDPGRDPFLDGMK